MMVISILRNLADAPARVATANPTAPAGTSSSIVATPVVTTIEAKAHPAAPVVPVGERAAAEPVIPAKAPSLAAFGSSLL